AGLQLGGGKAVIIGDPSTLKSVALLAAYGRFVAGPTGSGRILLVEKDASQGADQRGLIGHGLSVEAIGNPAFTTLFIEPRAGSDGFGRGELRCEAIIRGE
ncbi:MAG: hypothetical protein EON93_23180, partial [Burkholderiales bacterium]